MDTPLNLTHIPLWIRLLINGPRVRVPESAPKNRVKSLKKSDFYPIFILLKFFKKTIPHFSPKNKNPFLSFFLINTRPTPRFFAPFRDFLLRRTRLSFAFHHRGGECFTPSVLPRHAASSPALQSKRRGALNRLRPRRYNVLPTSDSVAGSLIPCSLYP